MKLATETEYTLTAGEITRVSQQLAKDFSAAAQTFANRVSPVSVRVLVEMSDT